VNSQSGAAILFDIKRPDRRDQALGEIANSATLSSWTKTGDGDVPLEVLAFDSLPRARREGVGNPDGWPMFRPAQLTIAKGEGNGSREITTILASQYGIS